MSTTKQITAKTKIEFGDEDSFSPDTVYHIDLSKIVPSPFEPQERRRRRFKDSELEELGVSIALQGQFNPILVRPVGNKIGKKKPSAGFFEIVYGERRYLAGLKKSLRTIKCFIRDLSDLEVIELQYQENHQRQQNDPLDDAFTFKYLQEKERLSISQLADKFGTSERNVAEKLKLNDLIAEAVQELEDGFLPLRHAYYLAKFPAPAQKEIVEDALAYRYGDRDNGAISFDEFKEEVEENILRRLISAPFDPEDERLHLKGLICRNCPERTGYSKLLFPELERQDSCLNKFCFEQKTNVHFRLKRDEIAEKLPNPENLPIEKLAEKVPIVTDRSWADETPFKTKPLTGQTLLTQLECISAEPALIAAGERKGQETFICRDASCEIHHPKAQKTGSDETTESERRKLENDFNRKVSDRLRIEVFKKAMKFFGSSKVFFIYADLVAKLVAELLFFNRHSLAGELKTELFADWKRAPKDFGDKDKNLEFALGLNIDDASKILFLLVHAGELTEADASFNSQIRQIADFYARPFNYDVRRAEIRLELAPDEFKQIAEDYYNKLLTGTLPPDSHPPAFWCREPDTSE